MDATPALRRSARKPASRAGRKHTPAKQPSTPLPPPKFANAIALDRTPATAKTGKKAVRFAVETPPSYDKENDVPSEDELLAATIVPTPKSSKPHQKLATPTPKKTTRIQLQPRTPRTPATLPPSNNLKRKLASEEGELETPRDRRKLLRIAQASPDKTPGKRRIAQPASSKKLQLAMQSSTVTITTPATPSASSIPVYRPAAPLETPARRPPKPLKDVTPALRASAAAFPNISPPRASALFTPAAKRSVVATPAAKDIFSSSDSFVCPATTALSKGWQFGSTLAPNPRPETAAPLAGLATPARRPAVPGGSLLFAAATAGMANVNKPSKGIAMSCPPKRPILAPGVSVSKHSDVDQQAKVSVLATPARRPDFSFAQPTRSSIAKSTPPRVSPLKEAPKRPPGLSPLKSEVTIADVRERSPVSKAVDPRTPLSTKPKRRPVFAPSPQRADIVEEEEEEEPAELVTSLSKMRLAAAAVDPFADITGTPARTVGFNCAGTPTNRKLNFASPQRSPGRVRFKSDFDIYVDPETKPASPTDKHNDIIGVVAQKGKDKDSLTTQEVFGNSPPKTLGTRRESGLFLSSPDRTVSIGPFTARISSRSSPLKREYEKDLRRVSGAASLAGSPAGNFFLDAMSEGATKLVHKRTVIVPLKGFEDDESEDEDEEMQFTSPRTAQEVEEADEDKEEAGPLADVTAFLDVRTSDGADASASFAQDLQRLGAKVVKRWRTTVSARGEVVNVAGVNVVVFKDGCSGTVAKAKRAKVPCVGVGWVKECVKRGDKVPVCGEYLVDDSTTLGLKKQRNNSMVPRPNKHATPRKTGVVDEYGSPVASARKRLNFA
ncbi:hypothetical protein TWF696_007382 [Orbilia brochopaga]|uniref:BRCT domain-containing protein n=1 Tax=Orbilia brochopaga TaxID=3140254 RepID=A0AAV9US70_9PEZI